MAAVLAAVAAVCVVEWRRVTCSGDAVVAAVTERRGELDLRLEIFHELSRRARRAASLSSPIARGRVGVRPPRGGGFGGGCGMPGSAAAETSPSGTHSLA